MSQYTPLRSTERRSSRFNPQAVALTLTAVALLVAVMVYAGSIVRKAGSVSRAAVPEQTPVPVETGIATLTAADMSVALKSAKLVNEQVKPKKEDKEKTSSKLKYQLENQGRAKVADVSLILFEYNPAGRLTRVEGWVERVELTGAEKKEFVRELKKAFTSGSLILSVEQSFGTDESRQSAFADLATAADNLVAGKTAALPATLSRAGEPLPETGAELCHLALRRAMEIRGRGQVGIGSLDCNQAEGSWAFLCSSLTPASPPKASR
jgi:hypothetical protein